MKIGPFIISLLLVGLFVAIFGVLYARLAVDYGQDYNASGLSFYDKSVELNDQISDINSTINRVNPQETTDAGFVTAFLGSGWSVIKTTFKSFGVFTSIANHGFEQSQIPGLQVFKQYILAIAAVAFFMVVIGYIVGKDMI